jgi:putative ABC transport system permease protein
MGAWLQDFRLGLRTLLKAPEISGVALVAMAVAIGAATTVFTAVNGLLLRPLPFPHADRLVAVWQFDPAARDIWLPASAGNFADWRRLSHSFEVLGAGVNRSFTLSSFDDPETPLMRQVSYGYFEALGVQPILGRTFRPDEDRPGGRPVVLLSYDLWQRRFGGDPGIVGRTTELDGKPFEIVGVMPEGYDNPAFALDVRPQAWLPMALPESGLDRRVAENLVVGRLAPGVSLAQARDELARIAATLRELYPQENRSVDALVAPLAERIVGRARPGLLLLFGAVVFVLLVASANVANLLLARAIGRQREIAVRRALGAGRWHLIRQLVAEGVVLMLASGGLGLLLVVWGGGSLRFLIPPRFRIQGLAVGVDANVVLFALGVSLATGLFFGLVPALHALGTSREGHFALGTRGATGNRRSQRVRSALVVGEVALSLALLIGAGLLLRSFVRLQSVEPGFDPANVLTFRVSTRGSAYAEGAAREAFFRRVEEGLAGIPGVVAVGAAHVFPFFPQFFSLPVSLDAHPADPGSEPRVTVRYVTPGYFEAMRMPLLRGRGFTADDTAAAPRMALISATMARELWGEADPIGESLTVGTGGGGSWRVAGIVGDVRSDGIPPTPVPILYLPLAQDPTPTAMGFAVRTRVPPLSLLPAVEKEVAAVDPGMPVYQVRTLAETIELFDWQTRFVMSLLGIFAVLALGLAATGLYAVLSYGVSQRRREIGIRMALGARPREVVALILRGGFGLALAGVGAGLAAAFGFTRLLKSFLYGVTATDPGTYLGVSLLLVAVAFLASYLPALRATRVDPAMTLWQD